MTQIRSPPSPRYRRVLDECKQEISVSSVRFIRIILRRIVKRSSTFDNITVRLYHRYMSNNRGKMDAGEKELREIFEKTTINNIRAIIAYNEQTQEMVKKLEIHVKDLDGVIRQYDSLIDNLRKQLAVLQTKVFRGGS